MREAFFWLFLRNMKPIGIFDSGYGGLTVMKEIVKQLPALDYIYLGDNARAPYGNRSFDTVYRYTLQAVQWFFEQGCPLVILACNTASAKALRTIQQIDLPKIDPRKRVLGVIRPTSEILGDFSSSGAVGILATQGTILSESYVIESAKFFPQLQIFQQACPMWVPLIENEETHNPGADYFIKKYVDALMEQSSDIDTVLLACTHYPIIYDKIKTYLPEHVQLLSQGNLVANSLTDYLVRHKEIKNEITASGVRKFYTTDDPFDFQQHALQFFGSSVQAEMVDLGPLKH